MAYEPSEDDGIRGAAEGEGADSDDDMPGDREDSEAETYTDAESFCEALRDEFKGKHAVDFHGAYLIAVDPMVFPRARVEMVAKEIWELSGYRWTCLGIILPRPPSPDITPITKAPGAERADFAEARKNP
ncbi:hypothetical protein B0H15DRAFT_950591 [Mycena belliarum]|uniref:Uncharacterized protein n=1 Tax=Mycena belliarum TaxID=1033014 RepID=A0AAD6U0Q0_9AGAR|nr:hypothetical protein B0H15DRAFT_950591 [Mycena belliae]